MNGKSFKSKQHSTSPAGSSDTLINHPDSGQIVQIQAAAFSGPLPPPTLLAQYNQVIPNGAERIMAMAERQSTHRENLEAKVVHGNVASQTRGSYFAFIIVLVAIVCGTFLIWDGKSAEGLVAIIASLSAIVAVFFRSKGEQKKERVEKSENLQSRRQQ